VQAGKLRHKIVIQTSTEANNSLGEPIQTWTTFATVRAGVSPLAGRETFRLDQVSADSDVKFTIRHLDSVTTKMRISYDSRIFDIQSIANVNERDRMLILMCKERL